MDDVADDLAGKGHDVTGLSGALEGLNVLVADAPDLVVLDLGLPDLDGIELLKMMRAVSDLTKPYGVPTIASLNSIMVDATGMCGACMVPVSIDGQMVRKHACVDGPELDSGVVLISGGEIVVHSGK